jgi:1-acyl-sn-glycerol-3-phosphate acyltransferase
VIRAIALLAFWGLSLLITGPPLLLWALITGDGNPVYRIGTGLAGLGVRLVGVKIDIRGREHVRPGQNYIFMSNHVSNLDPPVLIPRIPGRCSVLVKRELFRVPFLGAGLRAVAMVPVDRSNREAAIESVNAAIEVLRRGFHMLIYPEGTRSSDGRLLLFKKGPFHLAFESGVPVIPVTMLGTYECWPKGRLKLQPGTATAVLHPPLDPKTYTDREALMAGVRDIIASALPEELRYTAAVAE